jgi:hypothetical protein
VYESSLSAVRSITGVAFFCGAEDGALGVAAFAGVVFVPCRGELFCGVPTNVV